MGNVQYINPEGLPARGYTNVVVVTGNVKTIYIGGQDSVDASGAVVGEGDIAAQTEQTLKNMQTALNAAGASPEHVVKWTIYIVQGQPIEQGFAVFQRWWGNRPNPPAVTGVFVAALARPGFLVEIDAIAVVPE